MIALVYPSKLTCLLQLYKIGPDCILIITLLYQPELYDTREQHLTDRVRVNLESN